MVGKNKSLYAWLGDMQKKKEEKKRLEDAFQKEKTEKKK